MTLIPWKIMVVDDEEVIRDAAALNLREYHVITAASAEEAIELVRKQQPDLILMDVGLPGKSGIEGMEEIRKIAPEVLFIMITAFEDVETVVAAMKLGAYDYVVKPLHMDTLKVCIRNALDSIRLRKEVQMLHERFLRDNLPIFIAESNTSQDVVQFVGRVAQSPDAPVLITGPTGTGKELIAGAIHYKSPNWRGPFVTLNCAAIPKDLLESELFGYERGAFTGAAPKGKTGLIEQASGGTLFLDEVGDLSPDAQAKLLRFLDSGEYYKVGATKPGRAEVRVVSATNRDLERMIEADEFRRDLFYRLAILKVELPSLEKRREDIPPIARHFLLEFSQKYKRDFTDIASETFEYFNKKPWPGNVRELRGMIERGVLTGDGPLLRLNDIGVSPAEAALPGRSEKGGDGLLPPLTADGVDLAEIMEAVEKKYLNDAMALADGGDGKAAQLLNVNYHTLRYRKKKLGVE